MFKRISTCLLGCVLAFYPFFGISAHTGADERQELIIETSAKKSSDLIIDKTTTNRIQKTYGKFPLHFIRNTGQIDKKVKFYERGSGHATFFAKDGVYLMLQAPNPDFQIPKNRHAITASKAKTLTPELLKLAPVGANKNPEIVADDKQKGKANYFIGNDPNKWRTSIPTYKSIIYKELYKGIDMKFYGNNQQMEYDLIVKPDANPSQVRFSYEGIESLNITGDGDLEVGLKQGKLIQERPYIYQEINGKRVQINGKFKVFQPLHTANGHLLFSYGFQVASYNKKYPLIIDPVLSYSTYLGGSDSDTGQGITVDASGNVYITGATSSIDFPVTGSSSNFAGASDVFVTKINAAGNTIEYSTYIGGNMSDDGRDIAVDASGNVYITGLTYSADFPVLSSIQPICNSCPTYSDAFIVKMNASGAIAYSTYLGGSYYDFGNGIAIDNAENAYITGETYSDNFPVTSLNTIFGGGSDAFITKINSSGSAIGYSAYLSGIGWDWGMDISVDTSGSAYVTGGTFSANFPTTGLYTGFAGWSDAFVAKINTAGDAIIYSTYLGGGMYDDGWGIAIDASGNAYVTGWTYSADFPTVSPIQGICNNCPTYSDAYVTKINASGDAVIYSTYIGGSNEDWSYGIAVDASGNAYIAGLTVSSDFPVASPIQAACIDCSNSYSDAFITKINSLGDSIVYSTYLGGNGWDWCSSISVSASGDAFITGGTEAFDFPAVSPIDGVFGGVYDAFVAKIRENSPPNCIGASASLPIIVNNNNDMTAISILNIIDPDLDTVSITITGITQDEPVKRSASDKRFPDGSGIGTDTAWIRAERFNNGDGRVYQISFTASDGIGGICSGTVNVCVPRSKDSGCIDDGQLYDSTIP